MDRTTRTLLVLALGAGGLTTAAPVRAAHAQGFGDRLRRAAGDAARRAAERGVQESTAPAEARPSTPDTAARATAAPDAAPSTAPPAAPRADAGRDFTPGTRVLFATDFARDEIGDFPRAFRLRGGNAEVADVGGTRFLRATSFGEFEVPLPETLPARFTLEFDFTGSGGWYQELRFVPKAREDSAVYVSLRPTDGGLAGPDGYDVTASTSGTREGVPFRVQLMADGDYVKVYMNGTRVANAPNAALGRARAIRFVVKADGDSPALFGNLRVAAGGKDLYAALAESGRVTADGILFDTNADRLRPESAPVLREIADMLAAHPAMRLAIEGHTDDVGSPAANQSLSARRAAAVARYLAEVHGVAAARLQPAGFGATRPVAPNDSEADRQRNRRVELVRR
jgi:outer membrane protein OmpA-like peptidoglycan-associated protein